MLYDIKFLLCHMKTFLCHIKHASTGRQKNKETNPSFNTISATGQISLVSSSAFLESKVIYKGEMCCTAVFNRYMVAGIVKRSL